MVIDIKLNANYQHLWAIKMVWQSVALWDFPKQHLKGPNKLKTPVQKQAGALVQKMIENYLKDNSSLLQVWSYFHIFGHHVYQLWQHCTKLSFQNKLFIYQLHDLFRFSL